MNLYKRAITTDAISRVESLDDDFWTEYEVRIRHCQSDPQKRDQMILNLRDTAARLFQDDNFREKLSTTHCTQW